MKKKKDKKLLVLMAYLFIMMAIYIVIIYPAVKKAKVISSSRVPSLSISGINEINQLFVKLGKSWGANAQKPNPNIYVFGQRDPM